MPKFAFIFDSNASAKNFYANEIIRVVVGFDSFFEANAAKHSSQWKRFICWKNWLTITNLHHVIILYFGFVNTLDCNALFHIRFSDLEAPW